MSLLLNWAHPTAKAICGFREEEDWKQLQINKMKKSRRVGKVDISYILEQPGHTKKLCVFCGQKPAGKTNEHVIPQWLISQTGDPKRLITIGPMWDREARTLGFKQIPFDQFQFPACDSCNSIFSVLEDKAKFAFGRLLRDEPLQAEDFITILSWLDKVRVGLWLGYYMLSKNVAFINPSFQISKRMDVSDRSLLLYKSNVYERGITITGANTPAFQYSPTVFSLRINNYFLFNLSTDGLISRRLGLPYPYKIAFTDSDHLFKATYESGFERTLLPLLRIRYRQGCTIIHQPMIRQEIRQAMEEKYRTIYCLDKFSDIENGIGKIYMEKPGMLIEYPGFPDIRWIPDRVWDSYEISRVIAHQVVSVQKWFLDKLPDWGEASEQKKVIVKTQRRFALQVLRDLDKLLSKSE